MDEIGNNPSSKRSNYSSEIRISNTKETIQEMKKVTLLMTRQKQV
jgi:hypothetical protein